MAQQIKTNQFQRAIIKGIGIPKYLAEQEQLKATRDQEVRMLTDEVDTYEQIENKMWYAGDASELEFFYKSHHKPHVYEEHSFYREVNTNIPRAHYPLASAVSNAFGTLLFNTAPIIRVNSGSQTRDDKYNKRLKELLDINDFLSLLQSAAQKQSYSGSVALKLNVDRTIANTPLITVYPKEDFRVHRKFGQVIYIVFYDYYGEYRLESTYGRGYISYKLYKGKTEQVLAALPETETLKDIAFFDKDGNILPLVFAEVIDNKAGGRSDYEGLMSSFHALDETYSAMINYIRKTKPNIFITEDIAKKDAQGRPLQLNEFDNVITVLDSTPNGEGTKIERDIHNLNITGYTDAFVALREMILVKVNLSPATIGLRSTGGARESSEALRIREQASLRARAEKLSIWNEKLKSFIYTALILDELMNEAIQEREGIFKFQGRTEFDINCEFGEFYEPTLEERMNIFGKALAAGICSVDFAIAQTFGNQLSDIELQALMIQTKQERGIPLTKEQEELLAQGDKLKFSSLSFK